MMSNMMDAGMDDAERPKQIDRLALDYPSATVGRSLILHADCFEWLGRIPEGNLHAIVTDPPYGVKEYELDQIEKRAAGKGGIWRIPPSFDGNVRSPLPRFTALNKKEREILREFFVIWARTVIPALRPGGDLVTNCEDARPHLPSAAGPEKTQPHSSVQPCV